jgi:uncharacterized Zn-finger protein
MDQTPDQPETVQSMEAACDGGGGVLGHPLVYLSLADKGEAVCPYCGRRFVRDASAGPAAGH